MMKMKAFEDNSKTLDLAISTVKNKLEKWQDQVRNTRIKEITQSSHYSPMGHHFIITIFYYGEYGE